MKGVPAWLIAGLLLSPPDATAAPTPQDPPAAQDHPELPIVSDVRIQGATVYGAEELRRRYGLIPGERLKQSPDAIAAEIRRRYHSDGYTFAEVHARLDDGVLTIAVDEGEIDDVEFRGVRAEVADRLRAEFAIRPGDIFNRPQAVRALDEALEVSQGALERRARDAFTLIRENGRRILQVNLRTRGTRSGVFLGTQGREDWYSPVDGFNAAIGFQSTIFDPDRFNHIYYSGYVSYKVAAERAGYAFGLERPFFPDGVLQIGGAIHDLTASDDLWRLSVAEQSLVAVGFRNTFRDYYRRKGYQLHAAVRPLAAHEWLVAWRDESHHALANEADFGLFRDEHPFRGNTAAHEGDLRAVILGYTFDSRGLARESPSARYRRHQRDDLFGTATDEERGVRIEWTSEIAPASFDHDFDFSRHVLNARASVETSPGRLIAGRAIAGFSGGVLPPQRVFGLGGVGSVHGYAFKEAIGERMVLLNGEFRQRLGRSGMSGLAFIDAGRVYRPLAGSTDEWLKGVGVGLQFGSSTRLEFGWRLDDVPDSLQVLFRLTPTF